MLQHIVGRCIDPVHFMQEASVRRQELLQRAAHNSSEDRLLLACFFARSTYRDVNYESITVQKNGPRLIDR